MRLGDIAQRLQGRLDGDPAQGAPVVDAAAARLAHAVGEHDAHPVLAGPGDDQIGAPLAQVRRPVEAVGPRQAGREDGAPEGGDIFYVKAAPGSEFTGPIKDTDGNMKLAAGKVISEEELWQIKWYVEGILGKQPT